jgi:hypothetical protein
VKTHCEVHKSMEIAAAIVVLQSVAMHS